MDKAVGKMGYEGKAAAAQASTGDDLWEMHAAGARILDFTAGGDLAGFAAHEALRAAVRAMLGLMGQAFERLQTTAPELAAKLDGPDLLELCARTEEATDAEVWAFVHAALPELLARTQTELAAWHEG